MNNEMKFYGIVLKTIDYKDNASIIFLLTPQGKESLIVRGAKKINSKTRSLAQILSLVNYDKTTNKELNTLTQGEVIDAYSGIKEDPTKMQVAFCILEKLYYLAEDTKDDKTLYDFLIQLLEQLKTSSFPTTLLAIFEVKLLYLLGLAPRFSSCPICNKSIKEGYFCVEAGGTICTECGMQNPFTLTIEETKILKYLYLIKTEKIDEQFLKISSLAIDKINLAIDLYYEQYLDFKSKSKSILKKIAG